MAEYIDRRRLFNALADYWNIPRDWDGGIAQPCEDALTFIEDAPEEDVVPVVHGRWEFDGSDFADIWKCTACGDDWFFEYDPRDDETRVNYCPNCGARMDGE